MPTRWLNRDADIPLGFDHGAQYFQVSNPQFQQVIDQAHADGAVALMSEPYVMMVPPGHA